MLPRRPMRDYDRARPVAYFSCARWRCAIEQLLVSAPRRLSPILGFLRFSRPSHQDLGPRPSSRDLGTMASWRHMSERVKAAWWPRSLASLFISGFAENVKQTLQQELRTSNLSASLRRSYFASKLRQTSWIFQPAMAASLDAGPLS